MNRSDAFKILGINPTTDKIQLKKAYRKKAIQHHPDKGGDEDQFKLVNNAYHFLSTQSTSSVYNYKTGETYMSSEMKEMLEDIAISLAFYLLKKYF